VGTAFFFARMEAPVLAWALRGRLRLLEAALAVTGGAAGARRRASPPTEAFATAIRGWGAAGATATSRSIGAKHSISTRIVQIPSARSGTRRRPAGPSPQSGVAGLGRGHRDPGTGKPLKVTRPWCSTAARLRTAINKRRQVLAGRVKPAAR